MLNMIVRNESARIERCLKSVLPYVQAAVIVDTGSTDTTMEIMAELCAAQGVPMRSKVVPFENFSQARNAAFEYASSKLPGLPYCQFALLVDADMELVVTDPKAFDNLDARVLSYTMMQTGGCVTYTNRRIANLNSKPNPYVGVTHEYLDLPGDEIIYGAHFIDHADGANRVNKYRRDIDLLLADLERDPDNGRSLYYLGNSYRDGNDPHLAIDAYTRRINLGGWDEETHSAMMNRACACKDTGDHPGFVAGMLEAYNFRPQRAEPLYDLAKHFREKNQPHVALAFAKAGLTKNRPNDFLFVNDFVYSHGFRYEYSIAGYYDEAERARSAEITNDLALDPACPPAERWHARSNLFWHTKPLVEFCPSFTGKKIDFVAPESYTAINPSIEVCNNQIVCNVRCVNYKIDEHGRYMIGPTECGDAPIITRNFLTYLQHDLHCYAQKEIIWERPKPAWDMVIGLEDIRLFRLYGNLKFSATVRELSAGGVCQMVTGKLLDVNEHHMMVDNWKVISDEISHQKNWMPMPSRYGARWMYRLDTTVTGTEFTKHPCSKYVGDISGSSQLIPFKQGFLSVVHEAAAGPDGKRTYWHRFAWHDKDACLQKLSVPFVFYGRQIEFCAGLAEHPDHNNLIISFGVRDEEAHLATVNIEEVAAMLVLR